MPFYDVYFLVFNSTTSFSDRMASSYINSLLYYKKTQTNVFEYFLNLLKYIGTIVMNSLKTISYFLLSYISKVKYDTLINQLIQYSFEICFKKTDELDNLNYIIIV